MQYVLHRKWGSMNKMIAKILEQEEAIRCVLSSDRKTASLSLTWQDKDVLESMNRGPYLPHQIVSQSGSK